MWPTMYPELRRLRKRVSQLECELKDERVRHLAREDALLNVALTAHGHRGVAETSVEQPKKQIKPQVRELSAEDIATREYYKQCAREANLSEDVAEEWFAAYLRGEEPTMTEGIQ